MLFNNLALLFIALKLTHHIDWEWYLILSPLLVTLAYAFIKDVRHFLAKYLAKIVLLIKIRNSISKLKKRVKNNHDNREITEIMLMPENI